MERKIIDFPASTMANLNALDRDFSIYNEGYSFGHINGKLDAIGELDKELRFYKRNNDMLRVSLGINFALCLLLIVIMFTV